MSGKNMPESMICLLQGSVVTKQYCTKYSTRMRRVVEILQGLGSFHPVKFRDNRFRMDIGLRNQS